MGADREELWTGGQLVLICHLVLLLDSCGTPGKIRAFSDPPGLVHRAVGWASSMNQEHVTLLFGRQVIADSSLGLLGQSLI